MPVGTYDVTLLEVQERFGQASMQRQELFRSLTRYMERLGRLGTAQQVLVDGSFVTAKQIPTDIDMIVVYREGYDLSAAVTDEERSLIDCSEVKRVFGFDLFSLPFGSPALDGLAGVYRRGTRPTDREKGILRLAP